METDNLLSARQASMPSLIFPATRNRRDASSSSSSFPKQGYHSTEHNFIHNNAVVVNNLTTMKRDPDAERIHQAAKAAGTPAFGIVAVDVWILHDGLQQFVHAGPASTWICPAFVIQAKPAERLAIARIVDPQHPQYCTPQPQPMGAGLAGWFWSTLAVQTNADEDEIGHRRHHHTREGSLSSLPSEDIWLWRDLRALTSDPFQPPYPRMKVLQEAGLGKATGVPFAVNGTRGVVLYLTRPDVDENLLVESANSTFLKTAAQFVGAACALSQPRRQVDRMRQTRLATTWRRLSARIKSSPSLKVRLQTSFGEATTSQNFYEHIKQFVRNRVSMLVHKSRGSNSIVPPPPSPVRACLWTVAGVVVTLWMLQGLSHLSTTMSGRPLLLAPFGAFMTLQYTQTSAPVSQPRNAVLGQTLCLMVAWLSSILPCFHKGNSSIVSSALQLPVSVAIGIALMQKLGLSHPPAAAALIAILTQPDGFSWKAAIWIWIGNVGAIAVAILVNNLSDHRQYPLYWQWGIIQAFEDFLQWMGHCTTLITKSPLSTEKDAKTLNVDSPTVPSMYYSDSDGTLVRNFDDEDPGDDAPLQF